MARTNTPKSVRFAVALNSLFDQPLQTRTDLDLLPVYVAEMQTEGLIKVADKVVSGKRGRPALQYRLTDKARKRVKSQRARLAKASTQAVAA